MTLGWPASCCHAPSVAKKRIPWTYLHAIEEVSRHDGFRRLEPVRRQQRGTDCPFHPFGKPAKAIFSDPGAWVSWGPPNQHKAHAVSGGYQVSGEWHFASGSRQATWMGAHCQVIEPNGSLRLNRAGRPTVRTLLFRKEQTQPIHDWNTIGMRGTASEGYRVTDLFVPEAFSGTREDPSLRRDTATALRIHHARPVCPSAWPVSPLVSRVPCLDEFIVLAAEKTPRGLQRPRRQSGRPGWCGATGSNARGRPRLAGRDPEGYMGDCRRCRPDRPHMPVFESALAVPTRSARRSKSPITFTRPPAPPPFSAAPRSSVASATSTPCRSRSSPADSHFEAVGRVMFNGDPDETFL